MTRAAELVIPLFRGAWGDSLADLGEGASFAPPYAAIASALSELEPSEKLAPPVTRALLSWLWAHNQFLDLDAKAHAELEGSVARALARMRDPSQLAGALAAHRSELAAFVQARLGPAPRELVCAEYSPPLQLELLGLTSAQLIEPVLDVGCGAGAALVRFLRAQGIAAKGLDRLDPGAFGRAGDWLTHAYGNARWGTVLSHLGFSLHFLHHHRAPGDTAYAYARAYMAILRSLRLGGSFAYTPALPFMEALLDRSLYRVHRIPFANELRVQTLQEAERATGLDLSAASHVQRVV